MGGNPERADVVGVRRLTTKEFIGRARLIHGDEYGYTAAKYINTHSKLRIDCKLHGPFWQIAGAHLSGQGCPKCGHIGRVESQRSTTKEFIRKARLIHGDEYSYTAAKYINANSKLQINCKLHGHFWQTPGNHLGGKGCPKCGRISSLEKLHSRKPADRARLYLVSMTDKDGTTFLKVGWTTKAVLDERFRHLSYSNLDVQLLTLFPLSCGEIWALEAEVKRLFASARYAPIAAFDGDTECFDWSARHAICQFLCIAFVALWPPQFKKPSLESMQRQRYRLN